MSPLCYFSHFKMEKEKKKKDSNLDFSAWFSFFVATCFFVLGLIRKFAVSSFAVSGVIVLPFFFTGS